MKKDIPAITLLKEQPDEAARLLRFALGTTGSVRIVKEMDTSLRLALKGRRGRRDDILKLRDVLEDAILVEGDEYYAFIFGIEAQSYADVEMPLRMLLYDVLTLTAEYRKLRQKMLGPSSHPLSREEYMRAFPEGIGLKPLVSIILDTSLDEWFGPESVIEMVDRRAAEKLGVPAWYNEKIRRVKLSALTEAQAAELGGELGLLSELFRDFLDGTLSGEKYRGVNIGKNAARLYNVTCREMFEEEDDMSVEARIDRFAEKNQAVGETKGLYKAVRNLMETSGMNAEAAMNAIKIPADEREACLKQIGL